MIITAEMTGRVPVVVYDGNGTRLDNVVSVDLETGYVIRWFDPDGRMGKPEPLPLRLVAYPDTHRYEITGLAMLEFLRRSSDLERRINHRCREWRARDAEAWRAIERRATPYPSLLGDCFVDLAMKILDADPATGRLRQ